ncbi:MAG: hypothetical protein H7A24_05300 [Leptospiraceae bacterium]|nr:hypothetical protein [Leptospiraceae bacterium]MCP5511274.1 hypothetical protein [Leptospiraceae bacterium]
MKTKKSSFPIDEKKVRYSEWSFLMQILFKIIFSTIVLFMLSHCAIKENQLRAIEKFGKTTEEISDLSAKELIRMRESTITMNLELLKLGTNTPGKPNPNNLDEALDPQSLTLRLKSILALRSYGLLLLSLARQDSAGDITRAAGNFLDNLDSLTPETKKFDSEKKANFLKNISFFTSIFTSYQKKAALKEIITGSKPQVDILCELLSMEFDYKKGKRMSLQYQVTTDRLIISSDEVLDMETDRSIKNTALYAMHLATENKKIRENLHLKISDTFQELKKSNAELTAAFLEERIEMDDIKDFIQKTKTIEELTRVMTKR